MQVFAKSLPHYQGRLNLGKAQPSRGKGFAIEELKKTLFRFLKEGESGYLLFLCITAPAAKAAREGGKRVTARENTDT